MWSTELRYFTHEGYKAVKKRRLSGNPEIVFPRKMIAIFVDGCFWHGCRICRKHESLRSQVWVNKIYLQGERELRITRELSDVCWKVFRIPEHDIGTKKVLAETIDRLVPQIRAASPEKVVFGRGDYGVNKAGP